MRLARAFQFTLDLNIIYEAQKLHTKDWLHMYSFYETIYEPNRLTMALSQ